MPAVGVPGGASSNTFFAEPCFGGDSARSWVVDRVLEFQSMKPRFAECPLGQCGYSLGAQSAAARRWGHPIRELGSAVPQIHPLCCDSAEEFIFLGAAIAQWHSDSLAHPSLHWVSQPRASSIESARRMCQR